MIFFLTLLSEDLSIGRILSEKNSAGTGLLYQKTEALYDEPNKTAEAATRSYSAAGDFLQYIFSVLVAMNYQDIQSGCLVHEFFFTDITASVLHDCGYLLLV